MSLTSTLQVLFSQTTGSSERKMTASLRGSVGGKEPSFERRDPASAHSYSVISGSGTSSRLFLIPSYYTQTQATKREADEEDREAYAYVLWSEDEGQAKATDQAHHR
jgi:hypothetical protein